jgi:valyl-tRNA synthetase
MLAAYPVEDPAFVDAGSERNIAALIGAIRAMRNLRAELGLPPSSRQPGAVVAASASVREVFEANLALVTPLARLTELRVLDAPPTGEGKWVGTPVDEAEVFLQIGEALDVPKELERIDRELASLEADLAKSRAKLLNPQFTNKAPAAIVEKERAYAASLEEKHAKLSARRSMLQG